MEDKVMLFFRFGKRCIKKIKTCFARQFISAHSICVHYCCSIYEKILIL